MAAAASKASESGRRPEGGGNLKMKRRKHIVEGINLKSWRREEMDDAAEELGGCWPKYRSLAIRKLRQSRENRRRMLSMAYEMKSKAMPSRHRGGNNEEKERQIESYASEEIEISVAAAENGAWRRNNQKQEMSRNEAAKRRRRK